jgi:hypothetical protein
MKTGAADIPFGEFVILRPVNVGARFNRGNHLVESESTDL